MQSNERRQIKFRAWDKHIEVMVDPENLQLDGSGLVARYYQDCDDEDSIWVTDSITLKEIILLQFTGLKDKNGKEIYEGDIVKAGGSMTFSNPNVHQGLTKIVKWLESGFTLVGRQGIEIPNIAGNISNYQFWNVHRDLEVIGNIWQNPELINPIELEKRG